MASFFDRVKQLSTLAASGVAVVQAARKGEVGKAVGATLDLVNAIQARKKQGGHIAFLNGAASEDALKAVALGVDDHETRMAALEEAVLKLSGGVY